MTDMKNKKPILLLPNRMHDAIMDDDPKFLEHLFSTYRRKWLLAGAVFYDVSEEDYDKARAYNLVYGEVSPNDEPDAPGVDYNEYIR